MKTKHFIERLRYIMIVISSLILLNLLLNSCNLFDSHDKETTANEYVYEAFNEWYLWYDQIPKIDPNDYSTFAELIDTLKVDQDRWSFAGSYTEIMKLFQSGEYKGFGAGFMIDFDNQIKITHVYNQSPFGLFGVQRGWIVESVNAYTINNIDKIEEALSSTNDVTFVFTDNLGQTQNLTTSKTAFQMNTVLYANVFDFDTHKIGYLVFDSFLEISEAELDSTFKIFSQQNITNLIVDLRYNGGGLNDIADLLIGIIGGNKVNGQTVATLTHNDKKEIYNEPTVIDYNGIKLNINQVHFITTSGTASASELVINCLEPFMDVKLVGSTTHGKPVGMYILSIKEIDLAILPISFKTTNSLGYGDYYNGIPVDITEIDDLTHNWGNPDEALFKAAVNDIISPVAVASVPLKSEKIKNQRLFYYKGLNQIINAY